ncbi:hypothetical protein AOQ84DRAFT_278115, partial [Glonium stellatum]
EKAPVVRLEVHQFNADNCPAFVALSYTWGVNDGYPLVIDSTVCIVRLTLYKFLYYARPETGPSCWYWIDELCTNQSSLDEKNYIVPRMKSIYEKASKIVIWLG